MNKNSLNLLFIGGDKRQEHIHRIINKKFKNSFKAAIGANEMDSYKLKNADIIILPTIASLDNYTVNAPDSATKILMQDIIDGSNGCRAIVCGKISQSLIDKIENSGKSCYQYIESQTFKILNSIPTAEGAISLAINNTEKTLWGSQCLVIGNGCIGKALSRLLKNFGADITVSARKEEDFADISAKGFRSIETSKINTIIDKYDIIFNTVPFRVIENDVLIKLSSDVLIIDLASKPYGLDHSLLDDYKCKIILASSLPGIYSPITAAEIAAATIEQIIINEVNSNE